MCLDVFWINMRLWYIVFYIVRSASQVPVKWLLLNETLTWNGFNITFEEILFGLISGDEVVSGLNIRCQDYLFCPPPAIK